MDMLLLQPPTAQSRPLNRKEHGRLKLAQTRDPATLKEMK
jgi:hypothetical protein